MAIFVSLPEGTVHPESETDICQDHPRILIHIVFQTIARLAPDSKPRRHHCVTLFQGTDDRNSNTLSSTRRNPDSCAPRTQIWLLQLFEVTTAVDPTYLLHSLVPHCKCEDFSQYKGPKQTCFVCDCMELSANG